jgi:hypothetical protein
MPAACFILMMQPTASRKSNMLRAKKKFSVLLNLLVTSYSLLIWARIGIVRSKVGKSIPSTIIVAETISRRRTLVAVNVVEMAEVMFSSSLCWLGRIWQIQDSSRKAE